MEDQLMKNRVKIIFNPMNKVVEVEKGTILLDAIREAGIMIRSICGGEGECGTCKVILNKGEVSPISTKQEKRLSPEEISQGYHLACQIRVLSDSEFTIPVESRVFSPKILLKMESVIDRINPAVRKYLITPPAPQEGGQYQVRLEGYSGPAPQLCEGIYEKIKELSGGGQLTATLTTTGGRPEIIDVELGDRRESNYGLAIDLGTTTVVAFLVDLTDGKIIGKMSELNNQITYGEALVSRIAYGSEPKGLKRLQEEAVRSINDLIHKLARSASIREEEITDLTVGGNTVMNHLLAGKDPSYLAYVDGNEKVSRDPIIMKAKEVGVHTNPEAYIYCLPNVSRFLGGDAIGDVLASGMHKSGEISLLVDMGTNGEIIIGNNLWLISCSCASGPAFEGGGIKFGMRAMRGGIEHVKINPETFEAEYTVIGDTPPRGICGSGIIDAAAEMFSVGILDFTGKIVKGKTPLVREGRDGLEYVLVPAEKTAIGRDIVITQRDMDYLMDSKAANCGAIIVLMRKLKISIYDIKNVYLAGAFGAYTDIKNATKFGIFPEFPNAKIKPIGNGSVAGAYATLLSIEKRREAEEIARKMFYVDLLVDPMFSEAYSESIYIPGNKEFFPTYGL
ncbi:MAG: ferredoxin [Candidatus Bathyarchaeota archaeon B26-2]|nr:MAG: ferredoxin [Candidatus Bathyarchaeota archaeon B26-2]